MKNILLVDDEQQTIDVFHAALSAAGYNVLVADNGKKALDLIAQNKFDAIVIDEMMPDMSGNDVIKQFRENPENKDVPAIVLTNYGEGQLIKDAINEGASDYILKYQMTPNDLAEKIRNILGE